MPELLSRNRPRMIQPQGGVAFDLAGGERLAVIDPEGEQVADLVCFSRTQPRQWLSSGRSLDYASRVNLTEGDVLYSNRSQPMLTIIEDTVGRHDFLLTPCSIDTFRILYDHEGPHPSCFENLSLALEIWGIEPDEIPTSFNIFMNVEIEPSGKLMVRPPLSRAGDRISFRAEMDLIVGLTACSAELSNNHRFKPIHFQIDD